MSILSYTVTGTSIRSLSTLVFGRRCQRLRNRGLSPIIMNDTLRATGLKTKREVVELGLRTLLQLRRQGEIKRFRGKLYWQGDLDAMRTDK